MKARFLCRYTPQSTPGEMCQHSGLQVNCVLQEIRDIFTNIDQTILRLFNSFCFIVLQNGLNLLLMRSVWTSMAHS